MTERDLEQLMFDEATQGKSALECCVRLKQKLEHFEKWTKIVATNPPSGLNLQVLAFQWSTDFAVLARVMEHIIKKIGENHDREA